MAFNCRLLASRALLLGSDQAVVAGHDAALWLLSNDDASTHQIAALGGKLTLTALPIASPAPPSASVQQLQKHQARLCLRRIKALILSDLC